MTDVMLSQSSALNLWQNTTFQNMLKWFDEHIEMETTKALSLSGEERDKLLDKMANFKECKKLIVNKVRNSI